MPAIHASPPPRQARRGARRACAAAGVAAAVLLLHAALLRELRQGAETVPAGPVPVRAATLRLVPAALPAPSPPAAVAAQRALPSPAGAHASVVPRVPRPVPAAHAPALVLRAPGGATASAELPTADAAPPPPPPSAAEVPVYATRLPGPALLRYVLQRGAASGSASLSWRRVGEGYELSLDAELQGRPVLGSTSSGQLDADGVAPLRLVERRRTQELRAVNFQRDKGRITFSGPQLEYALLRGVQDRLSWMLQLPAIVEAEPALARDGARLTLFVVGTRGDAEAWHFEVQGRDTLQLPAGTATQALHLLREPTRPYDTRVELWLDPQRQHLPVRVRFTTVPDGQPTELLLAEMTRAPG